MGVIGQKRGSIGLVLAGLLYCSATPGVVFADGKDGDTPGGEDGDGKAAVRA